MCSGLILQRIWKDSLLHCLWGKGIPILQGKWWKRTLEKIHHVRQRRIMGSENVRRCILFAGCHVCGHTGQWLGEEYPLRDDRTCIGPKEWFSEWIFCHVIVVLVYDAQFFRWSNFVEVKQKKKNLYLFRLAELYAILIYSLLGAYPVVYAD